jgi:GMP synthase (glutamine-hydrolysing)
MRVLALIHHEVAGAGVLAEVVADRGHELEFWTPSEDTLPRALTDYGAVIAFGGGMQADQEHIHPWLLTALEALEICLREQIPTLGVCLGGQMLARAAGGRVGPAPRPVCGWEPVQLTEAGLADPLFDGLPRSFEVYQWHSYEFGLPPGAVPLASSDASLQCFRVGACAWGVQWHPEVTGASILHWAQEYRPAPGGVPVPVDMDALEAQVAERIEATNEDGRQLCARFLAAAEIRSGADRPARVARRAGAAPSPQAP